VHFSGEIMTFSCGELHTFDRPLRDGDTYVPAILPSSLGDPTFCRDHGLRFAYVTGAMANGIASTEIVMAMARAGMLGFFGAAGLGLSRVESAIETLAELGDLPYGVNLIHSPAEPLLEAGNVELLLKHRVRLIEASAFLALTLPVVKYRTAGITVDGQGRVIAPNRIVAKVSRVEVATRFFSPPPEKFVRELVAQGSLTPSQAELTQRIPMAQDVTAEADSGGHTDNRPAITLIPTLLALRDRMQEQFGYTEPLRVGAAGGIATPAAVAAAFQMGAAYVLTGSVNQACRESGSSDLVREMLAQAEQADVIMAPAADMFEMGVKLQVLKRGTMFAMRAGKLYELYRSCPSLEEIPETEKANLEKTIFRASLSEIWEQTRTFWLQRDPGQLERARADAKHKMALVFRWYLGLSSRWANAGEPSRKVDYQVWCGPAMGAFNEWTRGSYLEDWRNRRVVEVAANLLRGACILTRLHLLRCQGATVPVEWAKISPTTQAVAAVIGTTA
jgi:PfaD family protein